MYLETERLILRTPELQDVDNYMEFRNSEFVMQYNAMKYITKQEAIDQFAKAAAEQNAIAVELKASGKAIGMIFTEEDSLRWGVTSRELSYFLRYEESRKGYMKEALRALLAYLFESEDLSCVAARCFAPNIASRQLLESLGFHCDGIVRQCVKGYGNVIFDDAIYSLLREEFH